MNSAEKNTPLTAELSANRSVWAITAATALVHLLVAGRYDFMRNELYFLAGCCALPTT